MATFHRNILEKKKPTLEIDESVRDFVELIVITWIFVERRRRDMERKHVSA